MRHMSASYALMPDRGGLHPFSGWRAQGVPQFAFLTERFPRPYRPFDLAANFLGYLPLGFLAVLAAHPILRGRAAFAFAVLCAFALSLALESLQLYLPTRISSNLDLLANTAGGVLGALAAAAASRRLLHEEGLKAIRDRLFLSGSGIHLGLGLLGLWLIAQLNPGMLLFRTGDLRELFRPPPGKLYPAELFVRVEAGVAGANALCVGLLGLCLVARGQPKRLLA